jgi:hypothetical protein
MDKVKNSRSCSSKVAQFLEICACDLEHGLENKEVIILLEEDCTCVALRADEIADIHVRSKQFCLNFKIQFEIWISHNVAGEDPCFLGYHAVWIGIYPRF